MGRRGPPKKPTTLRVLTGNPGKRPLNELEPKPDPGLPDCPDWILPAAKAEWERTAPLLAQVKVLTRMDRDALTVYCQAFARWVEAEEFLKKNGSVYPLKDEHGNVKCLQQFPQVGIARALLGVIHRYQQEFGMTPSARTGLEVDPSAGDGNDDEFFGPRPIAPPNKEGGAA